MPVSIDRVALERLAAQGGGVLAAVPVSPTRTLDLVVAPIAPFPADAVLELDGRLQPLRARGAFLQGTVANEPDSRAFIASSEAGDFGFVEVAGRIFALSSGPRGSGAATVWFDAAELAPGLLGVADWRCATEAIAQGFTAQTAGGEGGTAAAECRQLALAFDTDHEFYLRFAGDIDAAVGYVATLTTALDTIYARDLSVKLATAYLRLWPEPDDPWDKTDIVEQIGQFRTLWEKQAVAQADLVQLLMGRNLGGGVAFVSGLCTNYRYSLASKIDGYFPSPLVDNSMQNWDILVSAHEFGHNLGMWHTHSLVPPVDGCGSSPQDCTVASAGEGTLMSYCHLCAGGLANTRLSFHPANIAQGQSLLSTVSCNYTASAVDPIALDDVAIAMPGVAVEIDVLANDEEFNCDTLAIASFSSLSTRGASIARSVGTGPGGRDQLVYTLAAGAAAGVDAFAYTLRDATGNTDSAVVTVSIQPPRAPENPIGTTAQLDARYFALGTESSIPDYTTRTPYGIGTVAQVHYPATINNFASSGRSDYVGARFAGWIVIPTTGIWTFALASDEGSRLSIGDTVVVDHDRLHGMTERSGSIALATGTHAFTIDYFERSGAAGLVCSWSGPGVAKQPVPASQFRRGGTNTPADLDNSGAVDATDVALILDNWGRTDTPYDLTGDGTVSGADLAVVLFGWTG